VRAYISKGNGRQRRIDPGQILGVEGISGEGKSLASSKLRAGADSLDTRLKTSVRSSERDRRVLYSAPNLGYWKSLLPHLHDRGRREGCWAGPKLKGGGAQKSGKEDSEIAQAVGISQEDTLPSLRLRPEERTGACGQLRHLAGVKLVKRVAD